MTFLLAAQRCALLPESRENREKQAAHLLLSRSCCCKRGCRDTGIRACSSKNETAADEQLASHGSPCFLVVKRSAVRPIRMSSASVSSCEVVTVLPRTLSTYFAMPAGPPASGCLAI